MLSHGEMIGRIAVAAVFGGVIGYERDRHGRPVGLRTHLIVAMTAATFTVISTQFVYWQHYATNDLVEVDVSRIPASVVSGIGFLAGGAILRTGLTIRGLTTAAGLWLVTAIGMSAGTGMFVESGVVTVMGITALTVLRRFEDKDDRFERQRLTLVLTASKLESVTATLRSLGANLVQLDYDRTLGTDDVRCEVVYDVRFPSSVGLEKLLATIEAIPGIVRVRAQPF